MSEPNAQLEPQATPVGGGATNGAQHSTPPVRADVASRFKPGDPRIGRNKGGTNKLTEVQRKHLASTGLTPLQFFAMIWRDELYDKYEFKRLKAPTGEIFVTPVPAEGAKKIDCSVQLRLQAATNAAPYMHKKLPMQVETKGGNVLLLTADQLSAMSDTELEVLMSVFRKMGAFTEEEQPGQTFEGVGHDVSDAELVEEPAASKDAPQAPESVVA